MFLLCQSDIWHMHTIYLYSQRNAKIPHLSHSYLLTKYTLTINTKETNTVERILLDPLCADCCSNGETELPLDAGTVNSRAPAQPVGQMSGYGGGLI